MAESGNPVYERPVILVIHRGDHRFLLDQIVPKPGGTVADYDLVIASQPYPRALHWSSRQSGCLRRSPARWGQAAE